MRQSEALNPRFVNYLAYVLWSFPFTYILVLGTFYNLPLSRMLSIFFSFYYIAHSLLAVFTGFALFRMRPYAWHFFVFHSFVMFVAQFVVAYRYAENHIVEIPLALISMVIVALVLFLKLELRVPYFSPKIAWWESDPRYKISVPAQMTSADHFYRGDIMDISSSGCFIKSKEPLKVDQKILVKFSLFDTKFECNGRVVWRTESGVTHPKGVGVRFMEMDKPMQVELRETVKKLKSLSKRFKDIRVEEKTTTFEKKVQALISQRKS
jgi:Tfp pilus assembly protein PilZ